ncbi:unnamed protein product, partial [Rhizoctonia solani]
KGPNGCRRCARAGIRCEGYLATAAKHSIRENKSRPNTDSPYSSISPNELTSPIDPPDQAQASRSARDDSAVTKIRDFGYSHQPGSVPAPHQPSHSQPGYPSFHYEQPTTSPFKFVQAPGNVSTPLENSTSQAPAPPLNGGIAGAIWPLRGRPMVVPSQTHLAGSRLGLAISRPAVPLTPGSPGLGLSVAQDSTTRAGKNVPTRRGQNYSTSSELRLTVESPSSFLGAELEVRDTEQIEAKLLNELVLDRRVESNTFSFLVHGFIAWSTMFLFDGACVIPIIADHIRRTPSFEHEIRQTMLLISNASLAISRSIDYDGPELPTLHKRLMDRVIEVRDDTEMTRELALKMMEHSHQFISMLFKVGTFASVLDVMGLYGPIFRRACPEPGESLVNLPRCLTNSNIHLRYYVALDVLQSIITHRPMFFRYDLDYLSPQEEGIIISGKVGLRWLYGISDRMMIVLARMNTLFEDFGNGVDPETVQELENEIMGCKPVIFTRAGVDPILNLGRIAVQEAWMMAAQVYLYMGLCGANSSDPRVVKIWKQFMRLLGGMKPHRNPDSFLVLPVVILGVAATSSTEQTTLLERLLGVPECNRPGTVGNDIMRMLSDVWAHTTERPAVWADLRSASLRVTGI